jgi:hypothetical protein
MKAFKPSHNFVSRVMDDVRAYEATRTPYPLSLRLFLSTKVARYALTAAGALLGLINLIRMYLTIFSPVMCR